MVCSYVVSKGSMENYCRFIEKEADIWQVPEEMSTLARQVVCPAKDGLFLNIHLVPNAKRRQVGGVFDTSFLKISVLSPPADFKANQELLTFVAESLKIKKSEISLAKGETSRRKSLFIKGVPAELERKIAQWLWLSL